MFGGWLCRGNAAGIPSVLQDVPDGGVVGGMHTERHGTGGFETLIPVSLTHLEDAHTGTIRLFFDGLLFQKPVYDGGGVFSDLLGPVGISTTVETVELDLMLVVGRHMFQDGHITASGIAVLMGGNSVAVFIENFNDIAGYAQCHRLLVQGVGNRVVEAVPRQMVGGNISAHTFY